MDATVWASKHRKQLGVRVGAANRVLYFDRSWESVVVEIDGIPYQFKLTSGFWRKCPEFRDDTRGVIKAWLRCHRLLDWAIGHPPKLVLHPLGGNRFRLTMK